MKLGLSLSYGPPDWEEEMWVEVFDKARKKGKVVDAELGEHEFQYALINPQDGYGRDRISTTGEPYSYSGAGVTRAIIEAEKELRVGAGYGDLAFVLERSLPTLDFADYVGLHEHTENLRGSHADACRVELGEVFKRESQFVEAYANWVVGMTKTMRKPENGYFGRAVPEILGIIREDKLSPLEILQRFKESLDLDS